MLTRDLLVYAAQHFGTPLYVYDTAVLDAQIAKIKAAFTDAKVFYAMKANPNLSILKRIGGAGFGFEVVSLGELKRAIHVGTPAQRILINGPAKTPEEYALGTRLGATFIVDRWQELDLLQAKTPILLRLNPELQVSTHSHLATGNRRSKFGIALKDVPRALAQMKRLNLHLRGLHIHIGSAITNPQDFDQAFEKIAALKALFGDLEMVDLGGGWALDADLTWVAQHAQAVAKLYHAKLAVEPGRYVVAESGVLLSRVVGTKRTAEHYALLDAGMTELIRPMLYGAQHPVQALWQSDKTRQHHLAGPACESGDILAKKVPLPVPVPMGGVVAFGQAGAYAHAMSSNYLSRARPMEVWYDQGQWHIIRQRETPEDTWRLEEVTA